MKINRFNQVNREEPDLNLGSKAESFSISIPIKIMNGTVIASLKRENFNPRKRLSIISIGIFIVAQDPKKITVLAVRPPFLDRDAAIGKAINRGPAAAEPNKTAMSIPLYPDFPPR